MPKRGSPGTIVVPMTPLYTRKDGQELLFPVTSPMPSGNVKSLYVEGHVFVDYSSAADEIDVRLVVQTSNDLDSWTNTEVSNNLAPHGGATWFRFHTTTAIPNAAYLRLALETSQASAHATDHEFCHVELAATPSFLS